MFELKEVTPKHRDRKSDEPLNDSPNDADQPPVVDGPCAPEAGNCGPSAGCSPSQP